MYKLDRRNFIKIGTAGAAIIAVPSTLLTACGGQAVVTPPSKKPGISSGASYFETEFGICQDIIGKIIERALQSGGDYADVFFQHTVTDTVRFEDGVVSLAYAEVDLGAGIRVIKGDQTGYAFTEDLSMENLEAAADTARAIATAGTPLELGDFAPVSVPSLYEKKHTWVEVQPKQKIGIARQIGEKIMSGDPSVVKATASLSSQDDARLVANSLGEIAEDIRPMTTLRTSCVAKKGDRKEQNSYRVAYRDTKDYYTDAQIDALSKEAVKRTMVLFDAKSPPAGELPVVLAPASSGILLHEAIGHGLEADFNRKNTSIYSTMIGRKVAEDFVTIVDSALEPKNRGAINVDDEGVPGKRTVLIENGKLVSYMHDRISAKHYKVDPTGNGRRESFRYVPLPRMCITTMENGPHDPEEIIKSVKKGIYAVDFSNGEVEIGAGDYSFYVCMGYLIEDGKLTSPVKDVNLIGNGPDTLTKTVMVGNDKTIDNSTWTCGKSGQGVPVGLGLPTIKVSSITVGGTN